MSSAEFNVEIRERLNKNDDYIRPAIIRQAEKETKLQASTGRSDVEDEQSDEESDVEEDEEAAFLTPAVDAEIFRTIAAIRTKDPKVYDSSSTFFSKSEFSRAKADWEEKTKDKNKENKLLVKDYQREILLKHKGIIDEEKYRPEIITHEKEQASIKDEFKKAALDMLNEDREGDTESFFTKKEKTNSELKAEEEDYKSFLLQNLIKEDSSSAEAVEQWQNYKENPNVSTDDAFLMEYVLNRGWIDKQPGKQKDLQTGTTDTDIDADEEYLDEVDRFESKYNFRFEEEGGGHITSYGRKIEGSVRRSENKRAKKREREKANKERKKLLQAEEAKRLKSEKRKEIQQRLLEIRKAAGADLPGLENVDFEADFDQEKHNELMSSLFDEEYYKTEETEKPVWSDDDDLMMDADYLPGGDKYSEFPQANGSGSAPKDPELLAQQKKEYKELLDEYDNLDFQDVVGGDASARFKYIKTEPEDLGLTIEEILTTDDAELNRIASLKLLSPWKKLHPREMKAVQKRVRDFRKRKEKRALERQEREEQKQKERKEKKAAKKAKKEKRNHDDEEATRTNDNAEQISKKSKKSKKA